MTKVSNIRSAILAKTIFVALYVFGILLTSTEACDGYKLKINKLEHCDKNVIYKLINPVFELTSDCNAFFKGCAELTKAIKTFKLVYDVRKKGMVVPFKGERGLDMQSSALKVCTKKGERVDVSSYKDRFRLMEGQYTGTLKVESDSGRGCFKFDFEFRRSI